MPSPPTVRSLVHAPKTSTSRTHSPEHNRRTDHVCNGFVLVEEEFTGPGRQVRLENAFVSASADNDFEVVRCQNRPYRVAVNVEGLKSNACSQILGFAAEGAHLDTALMA